MASPMEWDHFEPQKFSWLPGVLRGPRGSAGYVTIVTPPGRNCGWSRERWDRCERCRHEKAEMMPGCFESGSLVNFVFFRWISGPIQQEIWQLAYSWYMGWTQTLLWDSLFALRLWDWHGRTGVLRVASDPSSSPILLPFHLGVICKQT